MNWFKQNTLLTGIAAVGILGAAVLLWFAFGTMGAANKAIASYKSNTNEVAKLNGGAVHPSQENLAKQQKLTVELKAQTSKLREALVQRHGAPAGGEPATFGQRVQKSYQELRAKWEAAGIAVPENFLMGMEQYRQQIAAPAGAVKELDYQLGAIGFIIDAAIKSGITGIDKFSRAAVAAEDAATKVEAAPTLHRYPVDIQCTGSEAAVQNFINAIAASPTYFFAFRAVRLQNEVQAGPRREDVRKKIKEPASAAGGAAGDLFAGFGAIPEAEPAAPVAPAAPLTDAEKLMQAQAGAAAGGAAAAPVAQLFSFAKAAEPDAYQFLGGEKVKAAIRFDLVVFQPAPAAVTEE